MTHQKIYITQNSPFVQTFAVKNPDGTAMNITGFTPTMFISKYFGSEIKYNVSVTIFDASLGIVRASINAAGTKTLPYGTMRYTLYLTPPAGENAVILNGEAVIMPTV